VSIPVFDGDDYEGYAREILCGNVYILKLFMRKIGLHEGQWRTEGCSNPPPPEIPKALQNRAQLNPIVKTVKKFLNVGRQRAKKFGNNGVKF